MLMVSRMSPGSAPSIDLLVFARFPIQTGRAPSSSPMTQTSLMAPLLGTSLAISMTLMAMAGPTPSGSLLLAFAMAFEILFLFRSPIMPDGWISPQPLDTRLALCRSLSPFLTLQTKWPRLEPPDSRQRTWLWFLDSTPTPPMRMATGKASLKPESASLTLQPTVKERLLHASDLNLCHWPSRRMTSSMMRPKTLTVD